MLISTLCAVWHWQYRGNMWLWPWPKEFVALTLALVIVALFLALTFTLQTCEKYSACMNSGSPRAQRVNFALFGEHSRKYMRGLRSENIVTSVAEIFLNFYKWVK